MYIHEQGSGAEAECHLLLRVSNNVVTLWVGKNYCKYFYKGELPDLIRQKLAMINTCDNGHLRKADRLDYVDHPWQVTNNLHSWSYNECPAEFKDIGWRVNDKYYYIVVPKPVVSELSNGAIEYTKESFDDARGKSKSQG